MIKTSDIDVQTYRIIAVTEDKEANNFAITALQYNSSIYNTVDTGEDIVLKNVSNLGAAPAPVTNPRGEQFLYSEGQGVFVGFDFDFQHNGINVSEYRVSYRIDNDNWQIITTATPSVTIRNVRQGTIYIQVQAYSSLNKGSQITLSIR